MHTTLIYSKNSIQCICFALSELWNNSMGWGYLMPLQPIHLPQKRAVRLIVGVHYLLRTTRLFESFGILTVFDLYKLQLGVFMYNHQRHYLPPIFDDYFLY